MPVLIWDGKYNDTGWQEGLLRIALARWTIETVEQSVQERRRSPSFAGSKGADRWSPLISEVKRCIIPSLPPDFIGAIHSIRIDPLSLTGVDLSIKIAVVERTSRWDPDSMTAAASLSGRSLPCEGSRRFARQYSRSGLDPKCAGRAPSSSSATVPQGCVVPWKRSNAPTMPWPQGAAVTGSPCSITWWSAPAGSTRSSDTGPDQAFGQLEVTPFSYHQCMSTSLYRGLQGLYQDRSRRSEG